MALVGEPEIESPEMISFLLYFPVASGPLSKGEAGPFQALL